jgi:hypothetical protein
LVPDVPFTWTRYTPATDPVHVRVEFCWSPRTILAGLSEQAIPGLTVLLVRFTVPPKPATGFTVMVEVPALPTPIGATEAGVAINA